MKETKKAYYFDTRYEAEEYKKEHNLKGEVEEGIIPGYMSADVIYKIYKDQE